VPTLSVIAMIFQQLDEITGAARFQTKPDALIFGGLIFVTSANE